MTNNEFTIGADQPKPVRVRGHRKSVRWFAKQTAVVSAAAETLARMVDPLVFIGLLILVLWLPIPLGSNRDWAKAIFELWIAALVFLQVVVTLLRLGSLERDGSNGAVFVFCLWGLWLLWILIQTLNLPAEWIHALSPHRFDVEMQLSDWLQIKPSQAFAMSVDRSVTQAKLYESFAYVLFFGVVFLSTRNSANRRIIFLGSLLTSGCLQVGYSIYLNSSGLSTDPFIGKPISLDAASGTFINRNHFAGYLELALAAGLGLLGAWPVRHNEHSGWKKTASKVLGAFDLRILSSRIAIAVLFVGLFLSQSRMGNTAALAGLMVGVAASFVKATRNKSWIGALVFIVSIFIFDVAFIGSQYGGDKLVARMQTAVVDYTVQDRGLIRQDLEHMARKFWLSGSGLGSFAVAFPEFRTIGGMNNIPHAHNDYYQFVIEAGVIGTAILGALVLLTLSKAGQLLWTDKDPKSRAVAVAGVSAIVALGVHSTVDFNLQIACNALTLVGLMAVVWSCPLPTRRKVRKRKRIKPSPAPQSHEVFQNAQKGGN